MTRYLDLDCVVLRNSSVELLITQSVGPRIIRFSFKGGPNLFAEVPQMTLDCPGLDEKFVVYGGHRLWHAPQVPARTHIPDNRPVAARAIARGVEIVQDAEPLTGVAKSLRVVLPDDSATVLVEHTLTNRGLWPIPTAPWAITALRSGGLGVFPQTWQSNEHDDTCPDRSIALWPYTDINGPNIRWGNRFVFVDATMPGDMLKFGFPNPAGWLGYVVGGILFVKHAPYVDGATYFDRGSSSQVFCMPNLIELETLGPRTVLAPGASVTHCERWTVHAQVMLDADEADAHRLTRQLKLADPVQLGEAMRSRQASTDGLCG